MCVCKKVLLGCTFIEIIFISDRALECFKPPDIFFFRRDLWLGSGEMQTVSFGAGVRNHPSSPGQVFVTVT